MFKEEERKKKALKHEWIISLFFHDKNIEVLKAYIIIANLINSSRILYMLKMCL
jgi:hypothetical protein